MGHAFLLFCMAAPLLWYVTRGPLGRYLGRGARARRALTYRRRSQIEAIQGGSIRVVGKLRAQGGLLTAPISGRPCVAFQVLIDGRGLHDDIALPWSRHLEVQEAIPFTVADRTGEVLVDTAQPFTLALVGDVRDSDSWRGWRQENIQERAALTNLLRRHLGWTRFGRYRYAEGVLQEDEVVSVGGQGAREVHPDGVRAGPREPPVRLVLRGTADQPLVISEVPKALASE